MRNTLVIVCALAILVWAVPAHALNEFRWTGLAGDGKYLTGGNWNPAGPPAPDPVDGKQNVWINNGDTVTVDATGALAGLGWRTTMALGSADGTGGDGHLLLVDGGQIGGGVSLGRDGYTGTVIQSGGEWLCTGGDGIYSTYTISIGCSQTGYGRYELQSGCLGDDGTNDPLEHGTQYFYIGSEYSGSGGPGEFIQSAGTRVQTMSTARMVISGREYGEGIYTMNGGTLRAQVMWMGGEWGGGWSAVSATWNINSTDVDIAFGSNMIASPERTAGFKLGHHYGYAGGPEMYLSAVEGAPGETVLMKIIGGVFDNRFIVSTPGVRDAQVAGLNNITMAFEKDNPTAGSSTTFEVGGVDKGDDYHGLCNNFALEGLIVGGAAGGADSVMLQLADAYDNMSDGADNDALYVENLTVNVDSWLLLNGRTIYYYKADIDDMTKILLSGGALVELTPISGDANMDVVVDDSDLSLLLSNFGDPGAWGEGDFNDDGNVDDADLSLLLSNFGEDACTPATTVPEPATLTLLGLGGLALIRRRRA